MINQIEQAVMAWLMALVDLTGRAFSVAMEHGIEGSPLAVEQGLYQAIRSAIEGIAGDGHHPVSNR
jgi:hypothetical protein